MNEQDINSAIELARGHDWIPLAAVVIAVLVRLAKSDRVVQWFPIAISPRWRAWAAVVLGVMAGVVQKLAAGGKWTAALVGGLVAGIAAVSGHELLVEGLRKGRDFGVAKEPPPPPGTEPPPPPPKVLSLKPPPRTLPDAEVVSVPPAPLKFARLLVLVVVFSCAPPVDAAYVGQARDLTAASIACRSKGLAAIRRGGTCEERRERLEDLNASDPDCLAIAGDGGTEHYLCRGDGGTE